MPDAFGLESAIATSASHVDFGIRLDHPHDGLEGLDFKFHYRDKEKPSAQVMVPMVVRTDAIAGELLRVRTKVTATIAVQGFWRDRDFIEHTILDAKTVAKRAFFDLVTAETQEMMGVHHGNSA